MKRNKVLTDATIQIKLQNVMLSERNQTQKAKHCMIPFVYEASRIGKSTETKRKLVVTRHWEYRGNRE